MGKLEARRAGQHAEGMKSLLVIERGRTGQFIGQGQIAPLAPIEPTLEVGGAREDLAARGLGVAAFNAAGASPMMHDRCPRFEYTGEACLLQAPAKIGVLEVEGIALVEQSADRRDRRARKQQASARQHLDLDGLFCGPFAQRVTRALRRKFLGKLGIAQRARREPLAARRRQSIRRHAQTGMGIEERAPSMADDEEFRDWWATYLRMGASPGAAVALTKMNAEIDIRDVLPLIRVPTLVIHREGDRCLKVEEGRYVASRIPGAKYVEFEGIDHLPFVGEQDEILDEIEQFVTGVRFAGEYDRVLATVISISFADPDSEMDKMGSEAWTDFVDRSKTFVHKQLNLFRGREVSVGDDETLGAFDGPARAIRCATAINDAASAQGVTLRIGLHTGECDVVGDAYSGFAVNLARKIASESSDGHILVSRTVKDLVAGSGLQFQEHGIRSFEGIDGEWRLFNVMK